MRIGLLGPVATADLAAHLSDPVEALPKGQAGSPVTLLAAEAVKAGHEVHIWTLDQTVTEPVEATGDALGITYLPKRSEGRGRDAYATEVQWLRDALRSGPSMDLLNAHWSYEFALGAVGRPEPLLVTAHDWAPTILRYAFDPYRLARLTMFARTHLRRPAMTTVSPYLQRKFRRTGLGTPLVVPNGVPVDRIADTPRDRGPGMSVVGISRGFDRRKNSRNLILAHSRLRRAGMPVTLTLYGDAHEDGGQAHEWARAEGVEEGIRFMGEVPYAEILTVLSTADLFVHPAREESFGMVLVEAMAGGTPVIGGERSGAVPWVLDDGAGVVVDIEQPAIIGAAMQRLLGDADVWERQSAAGLDAIRRRFGMDTVGAQYLKAYDRLLAGW